VASKIDTLHDHQQPPGMLTLCSITVFVDGGVVMYLSAEAAPRLPPEKGNVSTIESMKSRCTVFCETPYIV
jgi:hypothetical protein